MWKTTAASIHEYHDLGTKRILEPFWACGSFNTRTLPHQQTSHRRIANNDTQAHRDNQSHSILVKLLVAFNYEHGVTTIAIVEESPTNQYSS